MKRYGGFLAILFFFVSVIAVPFAVTEWMMGDGTAARSSIQSETTTSLDQINYFRKAGSGLLLSEILKETQNPYRYVVVRHLQDMGFKTAFPAILNCLDESRDAQLVWHSIRALDSFEVWEAEEKIVDLLGRSDNMAIRGAAIEFLGGCKTLKSRDFLANLTLSGSDAEKAVAALSLGRAMDERALPLLEAMSKRSAGSTKLKAMRRLAKLKESLGASILSEVMLNGTLDETVMAGLLSGTDELTGFLASWKGAGDQSLESFWTVWRVQVAASGMGPEELEAVMDRLCLESDRERNREALNFLTRTNPAEAFHVLLGAVSSNALHVDQYAWSNVRRVFQTARKTSLAEGPSDLMTGRG